MKLSRKSIIIILILLTIGTAILHAQNSSTGGIYLNYRDYESGKLSYSFQCDSRDKIKMNDFLGSSFISIDTDGKTTILNKDSIFGYRNCKNETYRFYKKHDEEFLILENKALVLYLSYKRITSNNGKKISLVPAYFFSKTADSEILPLTILNLKKAFPENIKFHDLLDTEFAGGEALSAFSVTYKMYMINYLLSKSNQ